MCKNISIIAHRSENGIVRYGWGGNDGEFSSLGLKLLAWYTDPREVDELFQLGQCRNIGIPGSEWGGCEWFLSTDPVGKPHSVALTEQEIFSKLLGVDQGYFFDTDHRWYYIYPGPWRIKIPLMHLLFATNGGEQPEKEYILQIEHQILQYMFGEYLAKDQAFAELLQTNDLDARKLYEELDADDEPLASLYRKDPVVFSYFDNWVVVCTESDDAKVSHYLLRPKSLARVESNNWR